MRDRNVNNHVADALSLIEIVNDPQSRPDIPQELIHSYTDFLNGMIEMGKYLSGEPTEAWFARVDNDNPDEIEYLGMIPAASGNGVHTGYFNVQASIASTKPGSTGARKKPPKGRLIIPIHIFHTVAQLDARRFRRCVICNRIFYAERLDALCCSPEHSSHHRTNEYRERRKGNYMYKKKRG